MNLLFQKRAKLQSSWAYEDYLSKLLLKILSVLKYCVIYFLLPGPTFSSFELEISAFSGHSSKYALGPAEH